MSEEEKKSVKREYRLILVAALLILVVAPIAWYVWHYETAPRSYCTLIDANVLHANMGDWYTITKVGETQINLHYIDNGQNGVLTYERGASDGSIYVYVYSTKFVPVTLWYYVDKGTGAGDNITFSYDKMVSMPISIYVTDSPNPHVDSSGNCTP